MAERSISRRNLVKAATLGAAAGTVALSATQAYAVESPEAFEAGIEWNGIYDVVVVGFGMAGEMSALTAAENGASVLVLEKAFDGRDGGNSRFCHQQAVYCNDDQVEGMKAYFRGLRGDFDFPTDAVIDTYCEEAALNIPWFNDRGVDTYPYADTTGAPSGMEHPEVSPDGVNYQDCFGINPVLGNGAMFKYLKSQVLENENIAIWFEAPAVELIQDPTTGTVIGVTAEVEGQFVNVRARNGVIMACGGYENDRQFMQDFVSVANPYPIAAIYNTGDGHRMCMKAGAHMSAMHNAMMYINCLYDDGETAEWDSGTRVGKARYNTSLLFVGADGTRFMNENFKARHGYEAWHGNFRKQTIPARAWCVFDEPARLDTWFSYSLADQCEAGIASGRVRKANSIDELAEQIGVPAEKLVASVERYNLFCEQGEDMEFHRDPEAMRPIAAEGPYYAFEIVQSVLNTQGGPLRNENGQVMDYEGNPIPHLYSAGEFGEIFTTLYQGAGNVCGCLVWGRVSGRNAAAPKDDLQPAADLAIVEFQPTPAEEPVHECADNQVISTVDSHCGDLVLRVTRDGDTIESVEVLKCNDSKNIGLKAVNQLAEQVAGMNIDEAMGIDIVTHATVSCGAFLSALAAAME